MSIKGTNYDLLTPGEIIEPGDEWYSPITDSWHKVDTNLDGQTVEPEESIIGYGWDPDETKPIRRPKVVVPCP